jgi:hypothetical protein
VINQDIARQLVQAKIDEFNQEMGDDELVIRDDRTIERDFGWVFFYTSRRFLETGDIRHVPLGNAPIIVDRIDATLHPTGTDQPVEEYIRAYENSKRGNVS